MIKLLSSTLTVLFFSTIGFGQSIISNPGNVYANSRHNDYFYNKPVVNFEAHAGNPIRGKLNMEINVMMNVKPDSYVAIFNITQVGKTAASTDSMISMRIKKFTSNLKSLGIDKDDVLIDLISFTPVYEVTVEKKFFSKTYNEVPKGFELHKNIHVRFKDIGAFDQIMTAAAKNEIYDFVKVDYFIDNTSEAWEKLIEKSADFLDVKKAHYKRIGYKIDDMIMDISEAQNVAFPSDRYRTYTTKSKSSVDAINKKHTVIKASAKTSKYYSKLPYHRYHSVTKSEILVPAVQFSYTLKIALTEKPKEPKPKVKKEIVEKHFYISESGNAKVIPIN